MRKYYRILRSIIMVTVITVVSLYILLYVALSLPSVQRMVCGRVTHEISQFLGTKVEIGQLVISPFNRVVVKDMKVYDHSGRKAVSISRVGGGVELMELLHGKLIFTYAEVSGLDAKIIQDKEGEPINVQFVIDAFKPKRPGQPPTKFKLAIRHVVIRRGALSFDRLWCPAISSARFDKNHIRVTDLATDVALPLLENDNFIIELKRLTLREQSGFHLVGLAAKVHLRPNRLDLSDIDIRLPHTRLAPSDIMLAPTKPWNFLSELYMSSHRVRIDGCKVCPSDFAAFLPELARFAEPFEVMVDVEGTPKNIDIHQLSITGAESRLALGLHGLVRNIGDRERFRVALSSLLLRIEGSEMTRIVDVTAKLSRPAADILARLGEVTLKADAKVSSTALSTKLTLHSGLGDIDVDALLEYRDRKLTFLSGKVSTGGFQLGTLLNTPSVGAIAIDAEGNVTLKGNQPYGTMDVDIPYVDVNGRRWIAVTANVQRTEQALDAILGIDDPDAKLNLEAHAVPYVKGGQLMLTANIPHFNLGVLPMRKSLYGWMISGNVDVNIDGDNIDNTTGDIALSDFYVTMPGRQSLQVGDVTVQSYLSNDGERNLSIDSRFLSGNMHGRYTLTSLPANIFNLMADAMPSFIKHLPMQGGAEDYAEADFTIANNNVLTEYFNLPVRMLTDLPVHLDFNRPRGTLNFLLTAPYLQQGRDKLISDVSVKVTVDKPMDLYSAYATATLPVKNNRATFKLYLNALEDMANANLRWNIDRPGSFMGNISLSSIFSRLPGSNVPEISLKVNPSMFDINDTTWHIEPAEINYSDKRLSVEGVKIWSNDQYATIEGVASALPDDTIRLSLRDINLDYIFGTLNINYVTFGGHATGDFVGTSLFTSSPLAYTHRLDVRDLAYNNGRLGDAVIQSWWDKRENKVAILAKIYDFDTLAADLQGGIWVKRDSLSFDFDANKVNVQFLQPFMSAFSSDVRGRASGHAKLYGTFSDIDLAGRLFADTIAMRLDYTNTVYSGSDSVIIHPGRINISDFILYDQEGHTALLNGWLRHRYFHEPVFEFKVSDARDLLCYNTDEKFNPIWYGKVYGRGGASVSGRPGVVDILVDMTTSPKSVFTFVLSDTQEASEYTFLTFTDRRREAAEALQPDTIPDFIQQFHNRKQQEQQGSSAFNIDLRASVTPNAELIIVMDPVAGDKIRAYGDGAMQMSYESIPDRLSMYGKYTLTRGTYNFSLQDIILKTFIIRPGSSISFNGDPYNARLDIDALYRVNTNLTDLDPSFAKDKDLNRTNVPVDAVLRVDGDLQSPDISFDIELPTLSQDVTRKVRSVISSEDMMNRQIMYLLALNRFYAPEYMGGNRSGNEFASIASTTLSSHITNILGKLTPNWNIAPYFRTDNGDFSDMEVDLALSSRLFNNRLLLNGNFGYRDRTTSSTTFIGDFDIEYLLNRQGTFRLKAYNHFNDQNYYLRSALTTQGIGIIYKHDFNTWFKFFRPKKKNKAGKSTTPKQRNDTVKAEDDMLIIRPKK